VSPRVDFEDVVPICRPLMSTDREAEQRRADEALDVGSLVFRCPVTQVKIKSGIDLDFRTLRQIRQFRVQVCCSGCMKVHAFNVGKGLLVPYEQTELSQGCDAEVAKTFSKVATPVIQGPRRGSLRKRTWS
jgi:hypothetical protein